MENTVWAGGGLALLIGILIVAALWRRPPSPVPRESGRPEGEPESLDRGASEHPAEAPDVPAHVPASVDGPRSVRLEEIGTTVAIYSHVITEYDHPVHCWTFVSDGLRAHGQQEIVLTVQRRASEPEAEYPEDPINLIRVAGQFARQGRTVPYGGYTGFSRGGVVGFPIVLYLHPVPLSGVPLPENCLAAILLRMEEWEVAKTRGVLSMAARLGSQYLYYPYPPWADPDRGLLPLPELRDTTHFLELPRLQDGLMSAVLEGDRLTLRVSDSTAAQLGRELTADNDILCFELRLDPDSDSCYAVHTAETPEPRVILPSWSKAERRSPCHVTFLGGTPESRWLLMYDGVMLMLAEPAFEQVLAALRTSREVTLQAAENLELAIEIVPDSYFDFEFWHRPPENSTYTDPFTGELVSAAWMPLGGDLGPPGVEVGPQERFVIMTALEFVMRNVSPNDLTGWRDGVRRAGALLSDRTPAPPRACIEATFFPDREPSYRVHWEDGEDPAASDDLLGALRELGDHRTRRDRVRIQYWAPTREEEARR